MKPALKAALALTAMFALGAITGGAVSRAMVLNELRTLYDGPPLVLRQRLTIAALERHVDLTDEQKRQVDESVARFEPEIHALRKDIAPRATTLRERQLADLEAVMTPEQRDGFAQFRAHVEERAEAQGLR